MTTTKFRRCRIDECDGNAFRVGHGLCRKHYHRLRRHGDPLGGGTYFGDPKKYYNDVALVYSGDECLIWPYGKNPTGYGMMWVGDRDVLVSRALCEEMYGPHPPGEHHAAHSCGKGHLGCVAKSHLSWKTPIENNADKIIHGTQGRGERNAMAKLKEHQVREILRLEGSTTKTEIARQFGVSLKIISQIHRRERWGWLQAPLAKSAGLP